MAKDIEIKCAYCTTTEKFVEFKEAPYHGWTIFGWHMNDNTPYAKCPKCGKSEPPIEEDADSVSRNKRNVRTDESVDGEDGEDSKPAKKKRGRPRKKKE